MDFSNNSSVNRKTAVDRDSFHVYSSASNPFGAAQNNDSISQLESEYQLQ